MLETWIIYFSVLKTDHIILKGEQKNILFKSPTLVLDTRMLKFALHLESTWVGLKIASMSFWWFFL